MNAYHVQDRIEAQNWTRHYQQVAREEKESELAHELEGAIKQHHFESLAQEHFTRHLGGNKKAISKAFDDDCEFQEKLAEFMCFMAETVARHQIDFEEEQ